MNIQKMIGKIGYFSNDKNFDKHIEGILDRIIITKDRILYEPKIDNVIDKYSTRYFVYFKLKD